MSSGRKQEREIPFAKRGDYLIATLKTGNNTTPRVAIPVSKIAMMSDTRESADGPVLLGVTMITTLHGEKVVVKGCLLDAIDVAQKGAVTD